jgi:predicted nuclease of predicted toxin-antitoxin system
MARFYADEQFPRLTSEKLRLLGHDVLTVQEAGKVNQRISDPDVLAYAIADDRVVLTLNRYDFINLHKSTPIHKGVIICSENPNFIRLAEKIHEAVVALDYLAAGNINPLENQLVRVYRDG